MSLLIRRQPSDIVRDSDGTIFYYGVHANRINDLAGNTEFEAAFSPRGCWGWEYVHFRVFEAKNGVMILERRLLDSNEITYFERLANVKPNFSQFSQ